MKATKSEVRALALRKGYELGAAQRFLGIEWRIGLYRSMDGRLALMHQAAEDSIPRAYGALAVWLRGQPDRPVTEARSA